jgi:integrase
MTAYILDGARVYKPETLKRGAFALELAKRFARATRGRPLLARDLTLDFLRHLHAWLSDPKTSRWGEEARSAETVRKNVAWFQLFWKWLFNNAPEGAVPMPRELPMATAPSKRTVAPTWDEMDACIAACTGWHRRLATLLRFTGLRVQQAMRLVWGDFDLKARTLTVRSELGKSRSEMRGRVVPISRHLAKNLEGWRGDADAGARVIDSPRFGETSRSRMARERDMARAWTRAKVRPEAWEGRPHHAFRKGFVSGLKRAKADDEAVEFLVGHSLGLRGVYTDGDAIPLRAAVALIPPLTNGKRARK